MYEKMEMTLANSEYYKVKLPIMGGYKEDEMGGLTSIKFAAEVEKWRREHPEKFNADTSKISYGLQIKSKEKVEKIKSKIPLLNEYYVNGQIDDYFYENYAYWLMYLCEKNGGEVYKDLYLDIMGIDVELYVALRKAFIIKGCDDLDKHPPLPIQAWNSVLDSSSKYYSEFGDKNFSYFGIILFDMMIDTIEMFCNTTMDEEIIQGYIKMILYYYKYLKKRGILLPEWLQKRVYELSIL